MTVYSALSPVSVAVYTALNVAGLTALAPGGVCDDVAQKTAFPFVLYEVMESTMHGLGAKPGTGRTSEIVMRLHVYSTYEGLKEAQGIMAKAIELLADPPSVTGFGSWAIFHDETLPIGEELIAGISCQELIANLRLYVTETV